MKLYWSPRSPFVRKVMVCAHELGIAERIETIYTLVSMSTLNEDARRINPLGRIPALVTDEGVVLYDSAVICEYLDATYGKARLFGGQDPQRWDTLRRHALADGMLETLVLWHGERRKNVAQRSDAHLATFQSKIASALDASECEANAPDTAVDIGHITLAVVLGYIDFRFADLGWRTNHPQLARWFESFAARPSIQLTAPHDELEKTTR
jgi:glutathione S-transferase